MRRIGLLLLVGLAACEAQRVPALRSLPSLGAGPTGTAAPRVIRTRAVTAPSSSISSRSDRARSAVSAMLSGPAGITSTSESRSEEKRCARRPTVSPS
jgi:hypothetical protein